MTMRHFLNYLIKNHYIQQDDFDIYYYGLISIILNLSTILSIIIVSFFLDNVIFSFFFLISFIPIRVNLGGYHCNTPISCLLSFNSIYLIHYYLVQYLSNISYTLIIILTIFLLIVTPYVSEQKNYNIYHTYKKNIFLLLNLIIVLVFHNIILREAILVSLSINTMLYLTAKLKHISK